MFRVLARGSAGIDVSFTRRAGHGLALRRRNERRAEERRNGKSRDRKFGSHQKGLLSYGTESNLGQVIEFRRATLRKYQFSVSRPDDQQLPTAPYFALSKL